MMDGEEEFTQQRKEMVRRQIERRGIRDPRLLDVMRSIPRHLFVPVGEAERAYNDGPLQIGSGQTISQPYIVAVMTDLLELKGEENVLEVGTGSGYQAAVLGKMARCVHSVERYPALASKAEGMLRQVGLTDVVVHVGDGSLGWPQGAPYDGILVTAAAPSVPRALLEQLADRGRLVIPVGGQNGQDLQRWQRVGERFEQESIFPVVFVPLRGKSGWGEDEWDQHTEWM
jgi:protein-L-isoaspartate(D-aspartate) O-methyltransferase